MLFVFAALALVAGARSAPVAAPKPHLLFALIDDWGWFDKCACAPVSVVLSYAVCTSASDLPRTRTQRLPRQPADQDALP